MNSGSIGRHVPSCPMCLIQVAPLSLSLLREQKLPWSMALESLYGTSPKWSFLALSRRCFPAFLLYPAKALLLEAQETCCFLPCPEGTEMAFVTVAMLSSSKNLFYLVLL